MIVSPNSFRIVVAIDFSDTSLRALEQALSEAEGRARAELHFATVLDGDHAEPTPPSDRHGSLVQLADERHEQLERLVAPAMTALNAKRSVPVPAFVHVRVGAAAEQLASLATEVRADLVVVGTHGRRGFRRLMMGSVAEKTVRLAPCPVLVVRPTDFSAMDGLPQIEPPCPACVATRERTGGTEWWCAQHSHDPDLVHIYSRSERLDQPLSPAPFGST